MKLVMFKTDFSKLLIVHLLFFTEIAHNQSCMKRERVVPPPMLDSRLEITAAAVVTAYSELNCIHRCYQVQGCDGINIKINSADSAVCELLKYQQGHDQMKPVSKNGWKYYNLKVSF